MLPESATDMLVLRPLGGNEDDIAAVFPSFEEVRPAEFAAPSPDDLGDQRAAGLLRTALRIGSGRARARSARWRRSPWSPAPINWCRC